MSYTFRNHQTASVGTSPVVITKPTGLAVGDLMVATLAKGNDGAFTVPTGWTAHVNEGSTTGTDNQVAIMSKVADSTDTAASNFSFAWADTATNGSGSLAAYIPGNSNPVFVGASANTSMPRLNDTTPASNALSTTSGNLIVGGVASKRINSTDPTIVTAGYTSAGLLRSGGGAGDVALGAAYDLSGAGGSLTIEFGNMHSQAEAQVYIAEFSDDAVGGGAPPTGNLLHVGT